MRISEFASMLSISVDTVRHYMDIGILTPSKIGGHYYFDSDMLKQGRLILKLKRHDFKLSEIRNILLYQNLTPLDKKIKANYYYHVYESKLNEVRGIINRYREIEVSLENMLHETKGVTCVTETMGVDVFSIAFFSCPFCKSNLNLNASELVNNTIITGSLDCKCGYSLLIDNGMMIDNTSITTDDYLSHQDIVDYIDNTSIEFMNELNKSIIWFEKQIESNYKENNVVLDIGTGFGLMIRNIIKNFDESVTLICNEIDVVKLRFVKKLIETSGIKCKVLYLACDLRYLPIKEKSITLLTSFMTTPAFEDENSHVFDYIHNLMKDKSEVCLLENYQVKMRKNKSEVIELTECKKTDLYKKMEAYSYTKHSNNTSNVIRESSVYEPLLNSEGAIVFHSVLFTRS